jgi:hypothetical protein
MQHATTPTGANDVFRAVNDDRVDPGIAAKLGDLVGNRGSFDSVRGFGEGMLGNIFGNRSGAVTSAISQSSGVRPGSALSLLSMGLPLMLGILRRYTANKRLDAPGLASLLFSQRNALERSGLDDGITRALGFGSLSNLLNSVPGTSGRAELPRTAIHERDRRGSWLPWAIAAGIAALALMFFFNRTNERSGVAEPARTAATVPDPSATRVYFEAGETAVDGEDRIKIASVADAARSADREIAITGYTDGSGNPDQNLQLAKDRAGAVREALVAEGVAEARIVVDPPAEATGTTSEAEAHRVDIVLR